MKKSTSKMLGGLVIVGSLVGGYLIYRRGQSQAMAGMTQSQRRQARIVRQMAAFKGVDLDAPRDNTVEPVLPNGMTQSFARKWVKMLEGRNKPLTYRHFSPNSLGLSGDMVVE